MTATTTEAVLPLRIRITQCAYSAVLLGALEPPKDGHGANDAFVGSVSEVARLLRQPSIWDVTEHDLMRDHFGALCAVISDLGDLDTDPDSYLDRLGRPRTDRERDVVRGTLLADRLHWTLQLEAMAR